jgi:putative ATP-binding cassette transporter
MYSIIGTFLTNLIGRALVPLTFQQQRFEADFRFNLVRTRENAEQIAMLAGESAERERHLGRFRNVVGNWIAIMQRQKKLTFFTAGFSQASTIFPYVVVSPAYFAGKMQLGGLMQTASAFNSVQSSLSYFITAYVNIAQWRAVIERLAGFQAAIARARLAAVTPPVIEIVADEARTGVAIDHLAVRLPDGAPLVAADDIVIAAGDHVLVTGPSGGGKSTLFRSIAGIWPFGSGRVIVPKGATVMMLPQLPYFPLATLATAVTFPAPAGTYDHARIAEAIHAVGLPHLVAELDNEEHWNRLLSQGEQQRLALARALLQAPQYLFLDEATASLDEPAEATLYKLLQERLKGTTIVSIGHRATLGPFHRRRLTLVPDGSRYRLRDMPLVSAAE